jgi:hypothetical protein
MSIESEKKRMNDFLVEQTTAYEATKERAREHCEHTCAMPDFAVKTLEDHVAIQIAGLEAQAAALAAPDAHA